MSEKNNRPRLVSLEIEDLTELYSGGGKTNTEDYIEKLERLAGYLEYEVEQLQGSIMHIEERVMKKRGERLLSDFLTYLNLPVDIVTPDYVQMKLHDYMVERGLNEH